MRIIYNILIHLYRAGISLASVNNEKAGEWIKGRDRLFQKLSTELKSGEKRIWFHCASLGEFEQGRPVIEKFKKQHPDFTILLTFFSPSGYKIQKDYEGADYVFYLPIDTPGNAKKFLDIVKPEMAIFVKYEFWFNFLNELNNRGIPTFLISGIFRKSQHFFKWHGGWTRKHLYYFQKIFLQDTVSEKLLKSIGLENTILSGDTRFDRVMQVTASTEDNQMARNFSEGELTILAGSTWPEDEEILINYINSHKNSKVKWIIAPHEMREKKIKKLQESLQIKCQRYTKTDKIDKDTDILIIDTIGLLSHLYRFADIAYIGGGFGKGIHNILEAAAFGLPVLFGPNYHRFREARELIKTKGAKSIGDKTSFTEEIRSLIDNVEERKSRGEKARAYVKGKAGATKIILKSLEQFTNP